MDSQFPDPRGARYLADWLTDFAHGDSLYHIRNARGKPLEDVGEKLTESNPLLAGSSFDRERRPSPGD